MWSDQHWEGGGGSSVDRLVGLNRRLQSDVSDREPAEVPEKGLFIGLFLHCVVSFELTLFYSPQCYVYKMLCIKDVVK